MKKEEIEKKESRETLQLSDETKTGKNVGKSLSGFCSYGETGLLKRNGSFGSAIGWRLAA